MLPFFLERKILQKQVGTIVYVTRTALLLISTNKTQFSLVHLFNFINQGIFAEQLKSILECSYRQYQSITLDMF